jgi:hypothetical protein
MDKMHTSNKGKPQKSIMLPAADEKMNYWHKVQCSKCLRCGTDVETVADHGFERTLADNRLKLITSNLNTFQCDVHLMKFIHK